jgi:hypothetical protein
VRFVGLSTALANAQDLADWLGITGPVGPAAAAAAAVAAARGCLCAWLGGGLMKCFVLRMHLYIYDSSLAICDSASKQGLFNFKPSVRPVPLECHIQARAAHHQSCCKVK